MLTELLKTPKVSKYNDLREMHTCADT